MAQSIRRQKFPDGNATRSRALTPHHFQGSRNFPSKGERISSGLYVRGDAGRKLRDSRVGRLAAKVRQAMPWLRDSDHPAVRAWAELELLAGQVYAILRDLGVLNEDHEPRRLLDDYRKLRQTELMFARELGMTPTTRLAIRASDTNAALDIAQLASQVGGARPDEENEEVVP